MIKKISARLLLMMGLSVMLFSCVKDNDFFPTDDSESARQQVVRFNVSDGVTIVSRDANPVVEEFALLEITRSPNNESEFNQGLTVSLGVDNSTIPQGYTALPADAYTVIGGTEVTFAPGEFSKVVMIRLDKSKLDLSKRYAVGMKINNAGTGAVASGDYGSAVFEVGIKNQWHGKYEAVGVFMHPTAGNRDIHEDKDLLTVGPRSVRAPLGDLGGANYYMILTVNADNTVTIAPSGSTPDINQSYGPNYYDPVTKSFHLHYSYLVSAPRIIQEVLTLK